MHDATSAVCSCASHRALAEKDVELQVALARIEGFELQEKALRAQFEHAMRRVEMLRQDLSIAEQTALCEGQRNRELEASLHRLGDELIAARLENERLKVSLPPEQPAPLLHGWSYVIGRGLVPRCVNCRILSNEPGTFEPCPGKPAAAAATAPLVEARLP